ncbi:hypothetical protein TSMEX_008944 [Taenia solium]|eukprot:TsM_000317100 transcript=TsM_000317100 gene=TsM_000317100
MCFNRSDYGIGDYKTSGFDDGTLSNSLISLVDYLVRVLLDQALWETSINLPPNHAVLGLLLAIIMAFSIPLALSVVCGLGFRALESAFPMQNFLTKRKGHTVASGLWCRVQEIDDPLMLWPEVFTRKNTKFYVIFKSLHSLEYFQSKVFGKIIITCLYSRHQMSTPNCQYQLDGQTNGPAFFHAPKREQAPLVGDAQGSGATASPDLGHRDF